MELVKTRHCLVMVPKGKYFLGDPCYAVPDRHWMNLLTSCDFFRDTPIGEVDGHKVLGFSTAHGDGCYEDQFENEYPVDAGMIGLVPEALIDMEEFIANYPNGLPGIWVKFDYDTFAETDGMTLSFGKHRINTNNND